MNKLNGHPDFYRLLGWKSTEFGEKTYLKAIQLKNGLECYINGGK